jgi:large repetitive protein
MNRSWTYFLSSPVRRRLGSVCVLVVLQVLPLDLYAQSTSVEPAAFDSQLFHPTPDAAGLVSIITEKTPGHLSVATGLWLDLGFNSLRVGVPSLTLPRATLVTRRFDAHLVSTLGIGRHLEVGLELPFVLYQGGNDSAFARQVLEFGGFESGQLGDVTLHGKYTVLDEQGLRPGVAAGLNLRLPTGDENNLAGEASTVIEPFAAVTKRHGPHAAAVNLGLRYRPKPEALGDFEIGHQLLYGVGISYATGKPGFEQTSALVGELGGQLPLSGAKGARTLEGRVAMRFMATRDPWPLSVAPGLGIGLVRGFGQPIVRVFLAVDFVTQDPVLDTDSDGVPDIYDRCPTQPEDRDGFEDADGCPDPDNDGDKIADEDDDCPNEAGPRGNDGCAIGTEPDQDHDGIPDSADKCPNEAEDYDGFQDEDGCPDPDNDHDGIPDYGDMCPDAPEDKNGFQDDDGCPDGGKSARFVTLTPDNIQLSRQLGFVKDDAALLPTSTQILDQLAAMMRDHLEIVSVKMVVYAERKNPKSRGIATLRAKAIFKYLASRGVESERLHIEDGSFDRHKAGQVEVQAKVEKVAPPPKAAPGKPQPTKHKKRR